MEWYNLENVYKMAAPMAWHDNHENDFGHNF